MQLLLIVQNLQWDKMDDYRIEMANYYLKFDERIDHISSNNFNQTRWVSRQKVHSCHAKSSLKKQ